MPKNDGKQIEKLVSQAIKLVYGKEIAATRLYDTKSARYFLPPSPADFMGVLKGGYGFILEAKSSDSHTSFKEVRAANYVKPTQYAHHRLWIRTGGVSIFVFHSRLYNLIEVWDGRTVLEAYNNGWKEGDKPLVVCKQSADELSKALVEGSKIILGK